MPESRSYVAIVAGVPRSGTSLVMQMLAAGGLPAVVDDARPPDPHNPRGYLEYRPARSLQRDARFVHGLRGRALKLVHLQLCHLPVADGLRYRLLLLERDLREVVASQDAMLAATGGAPDGPPPERLREIFAAQIEEVHAALAARPDVALLRVAHARLLADPAAIAREIDDFLGGGLDVAAMASCVDPALYRQRLARAT